MPDEDRIGYDALATAEVIAQHNGVHIRADLIHARQVAPAVVDLAKRESANLIVLGSYREGKYSGAPLGRAIEDDRLARAVRRADRRPGPARPDAHARAAARRGATPTAATKR